MGTRHLICVVSDGKYRVAQYGQWDGYPSGQGENILNFLKSTKVERLKANLNKCSWVTSEEYAKLWREYGVNINENNLIDQEIADKFFKKHPQFSRDTSSDILDIIANATGQIKLKNNYDFSRDSVFCEWAYVIDFDNETFEVYKGFNEDPLKPTDRFYSEVLAEYSIGSTYYPVKLVASFNLTALPSTKAFIKICDPPEEDDEEPEDDAEIAEVEEGSFFNAIKV